MDYRIFSDNFKTVINEIKKLRLIIENYIKTHPRFGTALKPVNIDLSAPEIIKKMDNASQLTGTGPMAAVAGIIAQYAGEKAIAEGSREIIIENGGDIYFNCRREIITGLYAGDNPVAGNLALKISPDFMPLAVCSSSSYMGHSISLGKCDLATAVSSDAALADCAATMACNLVKSEDDIECTLNTMLCIRGIRGLILVKGNSVGIIGDLPEIIRNRDSKLTEKITKHKSIII